MTEAFLLGAGAMLALVALLSVGEYHWRRRRQARAATALRLDGQPYTWEPVPGEPVAQPLLDRVEDGAPVSVLSYNYAVDVANASYRRAVTAEAERDTLRSNLPTGDVGAKIRELLDQLRMTEVQLKRRDLALQEMERKLTAAETAGKRLGMASAAAIADEFDSYIAQRILGKMPPAP